MAMTIMNDASASMTLGELNKNISELGKQLKKVSSGMRINGAGDGPSEFSISEKMRVRIRALDQDERNVLNGAALLRTAEGAIQSQIEIMKTIKQKVIDADNDTNTDLDRMTIQKEIDQGYQQIEDIAQETNYNGKRLLVGDTKIDEIYTWKIVSPPVTTPESSLDLIPDQITAELDGQTGPFQLLSEYKEDAQKSFLLDGKSSVNLSGGGEVYSKFTMAFGNYTDPTQLEGIGFKSSSYYYVLTKNPSGTNYIATASNEKYVAREIDISGCDSVRAIAEKVAKAGIAGTTGNGTVSDDDTITITFTRNSTTNSTTPYITGWSAMGGSVALGNAGPTNLSLPSESVRGTDEVSHLVHNPSTDLDDKIVDAEATYATLTRNIGTVPNDSGITVTDTDDERNQAYIKFVDGNSPLTRQDDGSYTVGKNATVYSTALYTRKSPTDTSDSSLGTRVNVYFSLSGKNMTLRARSTGSANGFEVSDGITRTGDNWEYQAVSSYNGAASNATGGSSGQASYAIDLSAYDTDDEAKLDEFINSLLGTAMTLKRASGNIDQKYEFIDTTRSSAMQVKNMDAIVQTQKSQGEDSTAVDLETVRDAVKNGKRLQTRSLGL